MTVRVVVADDHPVVRDGVRGMLEGSDLVEVVGEAGDGDEALAVVRQRDPDVVLLDLRMPRRDGLSTLRALRALDPARPRVLVLTTYDADADLRAAIGAGADGYLLKDCSRAELLDAVADVAAGRTVLSAEALRTLTAPRGPDLSPRETEVLQLLAAGGSNRSIAAALFVSEATVKTHVSRLYGKLGVGDRAAAVSAGHRLGLL